MAILITLEEAIRMLEDYEAAVEYLWELQEWEDVVELNVFLQAWTKYVKDATTTKIRLEREGF